MLANTLHNAYNDHTSPSPGLPFPMIKMKTDLLLGFWKQAYVEPVTLTFPSYKKANAFRLRLYVAVRPYRQEALDDTELHMMVNQLEAIAKEMPDGSGQVLVRKAELNEELARLAREAGLPWGFNRKEAEESERRMIEITKEIDSPGVRAATPGTDYVSIRQRNASKEEFEPGSDKYETAQLEKLQNLNANDLYGDD